MEKLELGLITMMLDFLQFSAEEDAKPLMFALGVPMTIFLGVCLYKKRHIFLRIYYFLKKFGGN